MLNLVMTNSISHRTKRQDAKWRKKDRGLHHSEHLGLNSDQREVRSALFGEVGWSMRPEVQAIQLLSDLFARS